MSDQAPLTLPAAFKNLRQMAVEHNDQALIELCDRALAGNQSARSRCIRMWYTKDR